jgi:hypothetical protein
MHLSTKSSGVTPLTLGSRAKQGHGKVWVKSQIHSQECGKMWRNEPTHSQLDSHFGIGVPMDSHILKE